MIAPLDNGYTLRLYRKGSARLKFICFRPSKIGYLGVALYDPLQARRAAPAVKLQQVQVQGRSADFYQAGSTAYLFWEDEKGNLYYLNGDLDRAAMIRMAESVKEDEGPGLPEYRLGWEPKEAKTGQKDILPGAVMVEADREVPGRDDELCYAFDYSAEPLNAPEGAPETVEVKGAEAQFWSEMSTLLWTDPETGICFRIKGHRLTKETMLRMAESVAPVKDPAPTAAKAGR